MITLPNGLKSSSLAISFFSNIVTRNVLYELHVAVKKIWNFLFFEQARLVFHGSRLVFHGSRLGFMVPGPFSWFFMAPGWFYMVQVGLHGF